MGNRIKGYDSRAQARENRDPHASVYPKKPEPTRGLGLRLFDEASDIPPRVVMEQVMIRTDWHLMGYVPRVMMTREELRAAYTAEPSLSPEMTPLNALVEQKVEELRQIVADFPDTAAVRVEASIDGKTFTIRRVTHDEFFDEGYEAET